MRVLAVTNIYPSFQNPSLGTYVEQQIQGLRRIGLQVDVTFVNRLQKGIRSYLGLGLQICQRVQYSQPDLIHVMYGGVMADIVTRALEDKPTVVSFCGSDLLGEGLSGTLRKFVANYGVLASHKAARRACGIVVKSRNLQDALPEDVDKSKVRVIPNGVDLERFKPLDRDECRNRLGWNPNTFHVLFPANAGDPVKRPKLAEAAVDAIRRMEIHVELHYLRGVPNNEVPVWLNGSNVVLLTSRHEGSPNIVKEALACNLPVVSVDVGDVSERINGIEGCYIAFPDPDDLAAKLFLVYSGSRRVAGRIKMQELSLECIALQLKKLYDELV